jgi:serine protease Do
MRKTLLAYLLIALPAASFAQSFEASLGQGFQAALLGGRALSHRLLITHKVQDDVRKAIAKVGPATVKIEVRADVEIEVDPTQGVPAAVLGLPPGMDLPPILPPPGQPAPPPVKIKQSVGGSGSGFIVEKDAQGRPLIVTNAHVVDFVGRGGKTRIETGPNQKMDADVVSATVTVVFADGSEQSASVIGFNHGVDLALVRLNAPCPSCAVAKLGDSSKVQMGDFVVALGAPFGIDNTATFGIVSNAKRSGPPGMIDDYIQTDTAINPGNSGGPMVDMKGRVIGVNSMAYTRTGGQVGINFAIPIHYVAELIARYKSTGEVNFSRTGISLTSGDHGELVIAALAQSARDAGLALGDVVVSVDGRAFTSTRELVFYLAGKVPGRASTFVVSRNAALVTVSVPTSALD